MDLTALGQAVAAVVITGGTIATGAYAWWLKHQKASADTRADVAESDTVRMVADAERAVYKLLEQRLGVLEGEVGTLRKELAAERNHSHALERKCNRMELHLWRMANLLRQAGIEPPVFDESDPLPARPGT